ncbi:MAG: phosphoribosylformylglycinamidine cyclo-ligase [Candidatus Magasanikbacteria bacterium CG10_big_fil_rev_8_21_14_0_10_40_10]|uniref:phosphoribosylformylglycinamidine cyclo-ligase n=1 Tax=Candidatus Magasanikbacteria bacterium CG10_big_fil_rev_8_21_14_0_10_40_10 TaxID=1974648 RepID=A0A2M6W3N2_9BACT|nr:MAG: phosphoribosylformylglycinamidine cyclo-ligase [Candidatus Magasanikbacteria bacterium CG10_big_fil_rev_8_21_14_0_10_40_10]
MNTNFELAEAIKNYSQPVLIQNMAGAGAKLALAEKMNKFDEIGLDLINYCCNNILANNAKPIGFSFYLTGGHLKEEIKTAMDKSIVQAASDNSIALLNHETLPTSNETQTNARDIVACVTGLAQKDQPANGSEIAPGDIVLGFACNGLPANGFELAQKLFFEIGGYKTDSNIFELKKNVGLTLLEPHLSYVKPITQIKSAGIKIKGISHITNGGFFNNIPAFLPLNCNVEIKKGTWPILPVFEVLKRLGNLDELEMYRKFNMGIGLIIIISAHDADKARQIALSHFEQGIYRIGQVVESKNRVQLV